MIRAAVMEVPARRSDAATRGPAPGVMASQHEVVESGTPLHATAPETSLSTSRSRLACAQIGRIALLPVHAQANGALIEGSGPRQVCTLDAMS